MRDSETVIVELVDSPLNPHQRMLLAELMCILGEFPAEGRLPPKEWDALKAEVFREKGRSCYYCGETTGPWCVDHFMPLSRGGSNDPVNLLPCCIPCNSSKSDKFVTEWRGRRGADYVLLGCGEYQ